MRARSTALWNANIHYHPLVVEAIPKDARRVLDVGCGDGILSAHLIRSGIPNVVGLDLDGRVLERAKRRHVGVPVEWQQGDLFDVPFEADSFDAVVSVATLHHMPASMVWPPPATYLEMKRIASRVLPGIRYRRHLLGRYSLIWKKPPSALA